MTTTQLTKTTIRHLPVAQQVTGAFDGGRITENKPIGFPQEFPKIRAVGPLLYWAWAKSNEGGLIGLHPHRGFEIMSYCLAGHMVHRDSAGNLSTVAEGGIQVMQTGSGISHEEGLSEGGEFFQIWFHPDLEKTLRAPAKYHEFSADDFQIDRSHDGVEVKHVLGAQGVLSLETDVEVNEVRLSEGAGWTASVEEGRGLVAVAIDGSVVWESDEDRQTADIGDLVVIEAKDDAGGSSVTLRPRETAARVLVIDVPTAVPYRLHI